MTSYKVRTLLVSLFLVLFSLGLTAKEEDAVIGTWLTQDKDAKVKIFKKHNKFYGKLVWFKEPNRRGKPKMDDNNPDKSKRKRKLMGLVILYNFVYDEDYVWEDGDIYDPKTGKTYSCKMTLSKDKNTLEVRGYIGFSLFGRTSVWHRVKDKKK